MLAVLNLETGTSISGGFVIYIPTSRKEVYTILKMGNSFWAATVQVVLEAKIYQ